PWLGGSLDFSFSGLKTAVARFVKQESGRFRLEDMAASLESSIIEVLVGKAVRGAQAAGVSSVAIGGGVAANRALANEFRAACARTGLRCVTPPPELCTDNAAMVAAAAYHRLASGADDGMSLDTTANDPLPLSTVGPPLAAAGVRS
ncbi:MAG: hypothetical protein FJX72_21385, partial [Armatimonadetes bacterium]|nr:hypothetical protein [Armatimonadota bacterium]